MKKGILLLMSILSTILSSAQNPSWQLWASGLPSGTYPKLSIAPNHDIYYGLGGSPIIGTIYKANTLASNGSFAALPAVPVPSSLQNNIQCIITNNNNEPLVGFFRNNTAESFMFRYDSQTLTWVASTVDAPPALGAFCFAKSPVNGDIYMGAKWSYVYKSTDGGSTFTHIDETALIGAAYPCYYPSWSGNMMNGAIYSINVDNNGRVYAGTEGSGVQYSDDGGTSWHPADFYACQSPNPAWKDSLSPMKPLSATGNLGALGFTANNDLVWNGTNNWAVGWNQQLGFADMTNHITQQAQGFAQYLIMGGLQVTKIVTTANGQLFLHTGGNVNAQQSDLGIYTSIDGINWTQFNTGITGLNDGQSQGSLAVDGNKVFMATHDGKIFVYDASGTIAGLGEQESPSAALFPNPASDLIQFTGILNGDTAFEIYDGFGKIVLNGNISEKNTFVDVSSLMPGIYFIRKEQEVLKFVKN